MVQLIITDEFVSGTQFRTAYLRILSWYEAKLRAGHKPWPLTVAMIGVQGETPPKGQTKLANFEANVFNREQPISARELNFISFMVPIPKLLAKDSEGRDLQTSALRTSDGEYITARRSPLYYTIECPNGGASLPFLQTSGSLDQNFGVIIYSILGLGYVIADRWPEIINSNKCTDCSGLLEKARIVGGIFFQNFPPIERVIGCVHR
jgi:hypothetical protein